MIQVLLPTQTKSIFSGLWLDKRDFILTQWKICVEEQAPSWLKTSGRTKRVLKVCKISDKTAS